MAYSPKKKPTLEEKYKNLRTIEKIQYTIVEYETGIARHFDVTDTMGAFVNEFGDLDIYRVQFNSIEPRYTVIKGIVTDANGNADLEDVFIQVTDQETDEIYGDYAPNDISMRYVIILPPGKYNMYISALDHEEVFEEIEIFDKASYKHEIDKNITLSPLIDK